MERALMFGAIGTFVGTIFSMILITYNTTPLLLILLPMWGLVFGACLARVIDIKKK